MKDWATSSGIKKGTIPEVKDNQVEESVSYKATSVKVKKAKKGKVKSNDKD